jgi:hypothetical protein
MAPEKKKYNTRENAAQMRAAAAAEKKEKAAKKRKDKADSAKNGPTAAFMDPKLWGTLQNHVDLLENLYCRLPLESFFALRTVCKSWYAVACKRMALTEPLHKPFFTLYTRGGRFYRLDGVLTYNKASKCKPGRRRAKTLHQPAGPSLEYNPVWAWKRRGDADDLVSSSHQIVASEGLVCRHYPYTSGVLYLQVTVHDWNLPDEKGRVPRSFRGNARSRGVSRVPHYGPEQTVLGMMVLQGEDHPFQIVLGSLERDTQVFDSSGCHSWETKPCRPNVRGGNLHQTTGCAACRGRVYITMEYTREILVYDFGTARWSSVDAPPAHAPVSTQPLHYCNDTLGAWNGRILDVVDDADASSLLLWELGVGEAKQSELWRVFDRMPTDLYSWFRFKDDARITVHASFCGDYVLVYSWLFMCESAKRYCLYNMATKVWQKLDVDGNKNSQKTVYIKRRHGSDDWDGWDK